MLNSYRDYYYRTFEAKKYSSSHVLCMFMAYLVIALPFYFAFAGTNFWIEPKTKLVNANYNYTGFYAIQINYMVSGSPTVTTHQYTNIPGNQFPSHDKALFSTEITVQDLQKRANIALTLRGYGSNIQILTINTIWYFNVQMPQFQKITTKALVWSIKGNAYRAKLNGVMEYQNSSPLSVITESKFINLPSYNPYLQGGFTYKGLLNYLLAQQQLLKSSYNQKILQISSSSDRQVNMVLIKKQKILVNYIAGLLQTLKFNYSTYLAFAIIAYYIFSTLFKLYIKEGMIQCYTKEEISL